jgi:excisionase family DNA binding protein
MGNGVTLEIRNRTTPESLLDAIRREKPGLLIEEPSPEASAKPGRRPEAEPLLTPAEVAALFRVDPKTVTRWAKSGWLTSIRTLGGHRRYREAEVRALLAGSDTSIGQGQE